MRFSGDTNVEVARNLTDAAIQPRNGAVPVLADNHSRAQLSWFEDEAAADVRVTASALPVIAQVPRRSGAAADFDAMPRDPPPTLTALGAHEYAPTRILLDGFE